MMLPTLIVIGGTCGSGKSTIARKLAEKLKYEFCDGDDYHTEENKRKMANGHPLTDEDRIPWLEHLAAIQESRFQRNQPMVLACSALKRKYRAILIRDRSAREMRVVMLRVNREELERRIRTRPKHFVQNNLLDSQLRTLELPMTSEEAAKEPNLVVVDADGKEEEVVDLIVAKLADS